MNIKNIAIIGLGLIGGSLAKALREKVGINKIYAVNRSFKSIELALSDGVIDEGFESLNDTIYSCDIIFLCTSVTKSIDYINLLKKNISNKTIVTDVGSTKSELTKYIDNLDNKINFIGGHPMAGSEASGYSASYSHLFENAYYVITPSKFTAEDSIQLLVTIVEKIGALPIVIDSVKHDIITGSISHIPHIVASALVNLVKETDNDGLMKELAVGGFKDITRIASSNPEIWESIIISNKDEIKNILTKYIKLLNNFLEFIDKEHIEDIYNFLNEAKSFRDSFAESKKNPLYPTLELAVDVMDKPGTIGEIATILGNNNINIKNLHVSNSREYEEGCIIITLSDYKSINNAINILTEEGYTILYKSQKFYTNM
ncbi:MAG: prephenate dehydrogenase [Clostridiales bacterium]